MSRVAEGLLAAAREVCDLHADYHNRQVVAELLPWVEEAERLQSKAGQLHTYAFAHPALTADIAVVQRAARGETARILLIQRAKAPFAGRWALPGGFVNEGEAPVIAAVRELEEETGLEVSAWDLELLDVFAAPGRDPRGWTAAVCYFDLETSRDLAAEVKAGDDAAAAGWFPLNDLPELAFDHAAIIARLRERLQELHDDSRWNF